MKRPRLISALVALSAPVLVTAATAQNCDRAARIPFRFEFSPVRIERGHAHAHGAHEGRGQRASGCSCGSHDRIRLIAGRQRGKPNRPSGWHPREWFERRGYDLENYTHQHERDGSVHRGGRAGSQHGQRRSRR